MNECQKRKCYYNDEHNCLLAAAPKIDESPQLYEELCDLYVQEVSDNLTKEELMKNRLAAEALITEIACEMSGCVCSDAGGCVNALGCDQESAGPVAWWEESDLGKFRARI